LPLRAQSLLDASVRIEQFDAKTDARNLRACHDLTAAGWAVDHPHVPPWPLDSFTAKWADGFDACPQQTWLATDDSGEPVGCYLLRLPDKENVTRAHCTLVVAPARRRAGLGTALVEHCAEQARRAGRSRLAGQVRDDSPGAAFAAALGARAGIAQVDRVLDVDAALAGRLPALRAEAERHAAGYSLLSWLDRSPEEFIDQVARMHNAMADAPRNKGVEAMAWNAERVRNVELIAVEHGITCYTVAARCDINGDLAGLTQVSTDGTPGWGFQMVTAVLPEHRGHRLGLLIKVAMLQWLAEAAPDVRHVLTGNAGSNEHMIDINARLGFEVRDVYRDWELDLGLLPAALPG